jgi:AraC-like DNA-binding protein
MVAVQTFSTDDFAPTDRLAAWSDFTTRSLFGAQYSLYNPDGLHAHQRTLQLGELALFSFSSNAHAVERTAALVEQFPKRSVMASLILTGRAMFCSADQMCTAGPGEALIYPANRPYLMAFQEGTSQVLLDVPDEYLTSSGLSLGRSGCIQLDRTTQTAAGIDVAELAGLSSVLSAARNDAGSTARTVSAWLAHVDARLERQEARGHLTKAMRFIERHSGDSGLDVESVAAAAGISSRHLSREFRVLGRAPMQYLAEQRIEAASRLLASTSLSMGEVALACGYGSPALFSRSFRAATGTTPRAFRLQSAHDGRR